MTRRHFLKASFNERWIEVSKKEWLAAERNAGFRPKPGCGEYATGGFGGGGINGTYTDDGSDPEKRAPMVDKPVVTIAFNQGVEAAATFFLNHVAVKDLSSRKIEIYPAGQSPTPKRMCMAEAIRSLKKEVS